MDIGWRSTQSIVFHSKLLRACQVDFSSHPAIAKAETSARLSRWAYRHRALLASQTRQVVSFCPGQPYQLKQTELRVLLYVHRKRVLQNTSDAPKGHTPYGKPA